MITITNYTCGLRVCLFQNLYTVGTDINVISYYCVSTSRYSLQTMQLAYRLEYERNQNNYNDIMHITEHRQNVRTK